MDELEKTVSSDDDQEILNKLNNLEEKLKKLKEFSRQSEELRNLRKKLVDNLGISSKKNNFSWLKTDVKRVQFSEDRDSIDTEPRKTQGTFLTKAQKSNSLCNLLTGLTAWQEEMKSKKSEIEMLKKKRQTLTESTEILGHEERIKNLEFENDKLSDEILHFLLQNMNEGKEEYQDLIIHLEDENKVMQDSIHTLSEQVKYLKENNRALLLENEILRQNKFGLMNTSSREDMERKFRKSMMSSKRSAMLPEANIFFTTQDFQTSPSVQVLLDLELEDRLSLDKASEDSFTLDKQIASWKLDDDSMHDNLKRIEQDHHKMEVIQMKLDLVKRYVRKHGVKPINKDTFIDPHKKI